MNGLEIIKNKFKHDNYAQNLGIILDLLTEDHIKMHMELTQELNNLYGRPHGGAIYSLADVAFSIIANNQNIATVALSNNIYYHASPDPGEILYVEGRRVNLT